MADPWLVVGLGNPGPGYAGNRHNLGAMVVDTLADEERWTFRTHKARAAVAEGRLGTMPGGLPGPKVLLAKPNSYMNLSGGPVAGLAAFFSIPAERILVVYDELDLPFGTLRLKQGGGEGGHNGLRDVSRALAGRDYLRLRGGIGRPPGRMDPADYVLRDFSATERKEIDLVRAEAADVIRRLVVDGFTATQQWLHSR